jgi:hypothetical protein
LFLKRILHCAGYNVNAKGGMSLRHLGRMLAMDEESLEVKEHAVKPANLAPSSASSEASEASSSSISFVNPPSGAETALPTTNVVQPSGVGDK